MRSIRSGTGICAHQVGHERQGALEDAHQGEVSAGVVGRDAATELGHLGGDLLLGQEDLADVGLEIDGMAHRKLGAASTSRVVG